MTARKRRRKRQFWQDVEDVTPGATYVACPEWANSPVNSNLLDGHFIDTYQLCLFIATRVRVSDLYDD
jgi:hypothetical protein